MDEHFAGAKSQGASTEELGEAIAEAMFIRAAGFQHQILHPTLPS